MNISVDLIHIKIIKFLSLLIDHSNKIAYFNLDFAEDYILNSDKSKKFELTSLIDFLCNSPNLVKSTAHFFSWLLKS